MTPTDMDYSDPALLYVYEIVKTVEVVLASDRTFRLEVVKVAKGTANVYFDVRYYERQTLYNAADGTITATRLSGVNTSRFYVWEVDDLPGVNRPTPESALDRRNKPRGAASPREKHGGGLRRRNFHFRIAARPGGIDRGHDLRDMRLHQAPTAFA
jgi:hypothetical protein